MTETMKFDISATDAAATWKEYEKALPDEIGQKRKGRRGSSTKCMLVKDIVLEFPMWGGAVADQDYIMVSISSNSLSAEAYIDDKNIFFKVKLEACGIALQIIDKVVKYYVDRLYIKKTMYIQSLVNGLAAAGHTGMELGFDYVYVNDWKLQRIISSKF